MTDLDHIESMVRPCTIIDGDGDVQTTDMVVLAISQACHFQGREPRDLAFELERLGMRLADGDDR